MIAHVCTRPGAPNATLRVLSGVDIHAAPLEVGGRDLIWVDVVDPQAQDIDWLRRTFDFHPLALEDVARQHQRPKLDQYPGYYFGVIYAVRLDPKRRRVSTSELQFFWGRAYLVTIHGQGFPEIEDLVSRVRSGGVAPVVKPETRVLEVPDLVYHVLDSVVDGYFPAVDALAEWTEDIEEHMFSSRRGADMLQTIFVLRKDLIQLRKVIAPIREVLNVLLRREQHLFGDEFYAFFQDVYDHTIRVIDSLDTYRDLLTSAVDTYLTIASNDVNQTVKKMTAVTAILMVDALVAGVYGMNFDNIPELHWQYGYLWALGLMLAATLGLFTLFRRIRWF